MTLIASYSIYGSCPVMIGDLLLSGLGDPEHAIELPTVSNLRQLFPNIGFLPTGLAQKVAIINDDLAISWSGKQSVARGIIEDLTKEASKRGAWNPGDLEAFFKNVGQRSADDVAILLLSTTDRGIFSFKFGGPIKEVFSDRYGFMRVAGAGTSDFIDFLGGFDYQPSGNPLLDIVKTAAGYANHLIGVEVVSGANLAQFYGGGLEILTRTRDAFKKINDACYLVWLAREAENSEWQIGMPFLVLRYCYEDGHLLIRRAEIRPISGGPITLENQTVRIVPSMTDSGFMDRKSWLLPSFSSRFLHNFVLCIKRDGSTEFLQKTHYSDRCNHSIRFENETNGSVDFLVHKDFVPGLVNSIKKQQGSQSEMNS